MQGKGRGRGDDMQSSSDGVEEWRKEPMAAPARPRELGAGQGDGVAGGVEGTELTRKGDGVGF